jgi:hypothetical protein
MSNMRDVIKGDDANTMFHAFCEMLEEVEGCAECRAKIQVGFASGMYVVMEIFAVNQDSITAEYGQHIYDQVAGIVRKLHLQHADDTEFGHG